MDVKELRTFVTLARTLSYQKASEQLSFAPSTLNRHIQMLEREMGVKLFAKSGRGMEMTREGTRFVPYAQRLLDTYDEAMRDVGAAGERGRSICISGCEVVLAYCLVDLLSGFCMRNPSVRIAMMTSPNARVPEMVRRGEADMGFYYSLDYRAIDDLHETALFKEEICLVTAANSPLARGRGLRYADLEGYNFAFPHDDCCAAVEVLRRLRHAGVEPGSVSYLGVVQLIIEQVQSRHALMAVPRSAVRHLQEKWGLKAIDLAEPPVITYARALYRSEQSLNEEERALIRFCECGAEKGGWVMRA